MTGVREKIRELMLRIKIICVGRLKEQFYTDAANEYIKRLGGCCKLEILELPEFRELEKEREAIRKGIPAGAMTIAMCIEGREVDSKGLSELLMECAGRGTSHLCFIIGGSNGLHDDIKSGADLRLSMSKMTFPHNLARVILLEQLYRAFTIIEGGKYHK